MSVPLGNRVAACVLILLLGAASSVGAAPLVIGRADLYRLGGASVARLEDPGRRLTIDDVASPGMASRFVPLRHPVSNPGISDSAFWYRFTIDGGARGRDTWLLLLDQPMMSRVDLYVARGEGRFTVERSGAYLPIDRRAVRDREIVLPLPLTALPRTFYLRTWIGGRAQAPLAVLTRATFLRQRSSKNFLFGAYVGFMLVAGLLGLGLYGLLRDRSYLLYAVYTVIYMLAVLGLSGFLRNFVPPERPRLYGFLVLEMGALAILLAFLFIGRFLQLSKYAPGFHRCFNAFQVLNLLLIAIYPVVSRLIFIRLLNLDFLVASLATLAVAIVVYRRGFLPARYYAVGRLVHITGLMVPLANAGLLPLNWFTQNDLVLVSAGDILFILLSLGHHFYVMNRQVNDLVGDLGREVSEREAANRALQAQMAERKRLEREIRQVGREERRRISHELHDGLCQQLTGAGLRFAALEDRLSEAGLRNEARPLGHLLQDAVEQAYTLSRELWVSDGSDDDGAVSTETLSRQLVAHGDIPVRLDLNMACRDCTSAAMPHVHRIAREAAANAVKHSGAALLTITLTCGRKRGIRLEVRDNGCGIGNGKGQGARLGIGMMTQRAAMIGARFDIGETPGGGTTVLCAAPCNGGTTGEVADG